jgi:hypothetical protein
MRTFLCILCFVVLMAILCVGVESENTEESNKDIIRNLQHMLKPRVAEFKKSDKSDFIKRKSSKDTMLKLQRKHIASKLASKLTRFNPDSETK